jgi:hypothetical protein
MGWTIRYSKPGRSKRIPLLQNFPIGPRVHPASYSMDNVGTFPGVMRPGRDANYSPLPTAKDKKGWSYASSPPACLLGMDRDVTLSMLFINATYWWGHCGIAVGSGTALLVRRSLVRFQIVSFIDIVRTVILGPTQPLTEISTKNTSCGVNTTSV